MNKDEPGLRSTAGQFAEFMESTIWADVRAELEVWLEGVRDGLEDTSLSIENLYRNQGRAEAVRYMLSLPETIRDTLVEIQRKHAEQNEEEE
jgi:hypothetical protein